MYLILIVWLAGNALLLPLMLLGHWIADQLERLNARIGHRA